MPEEIQEPSKRAGRAPRARATTAAKPRSTLSGDGRWWWNGRRWVPAVTDDGLWQWDGSRWQPTIDLAGQRAADLATTLALLAEDRYAKAATILVERTGEWQPEGELRERVREVQRRLEAAEAAHREALQAARSRLRALLAPGPGAPKARVGPLHLHAMALETPSGRFPADGASAELGRAAALWSSHHQLLLDAIATES